MKKLLCVVCITALFFGAWVSDASARGSGLLNVSSGGFTGFEIELRIRIDADGVVLVVLGSREKTTSCKNRETPEAVDDGRAAVDPALGARVRRAAALLRGLRRAAMAVAGRCHAELKSLSHAPEE